MRQTCVRTKCFQLHASRSGKGSSTIHRILVAKHCFGEATAHLEAFPGGQALGQPFTSCQVNEVKDPLDALPRGCTLPFDLECEHTVGPGGPVVQGSRPHTPLREGLLHQILKAPRARHVNDDEVRHCGVTSRVMDDLQARQESQGLKCLQHPALSRQRAQPQSGHVPGCGGVVRAAV